MKVGFVGTGKLGLPVSLMYNVKGHELYCYDVNKNFYEVGMNPADLLYDEELCPENKIKLKNWLQTSSFDSNKYIHTDLSTLVDNADLIFIAVQTPHDKEYEGITRLPPIRKDFDYTYLIESIKQLSAIVESKKKNTICIIISTVLPGTIRSQILPVMSPYISLCYNPYFIAMGTVAYDCTHPEFILLGNHNQNAAEVVTKFYSTITNSPVHVTSLENAEMIKVCYNTFISTKIAMANTIMELCHSCPNTNCDDVIDALSKATQRLISPAYLRGGMGDGGGCHPRDNIALSWLSNKISMRYNWFDSIMKAREQQTEFLVDIIKKEHNESKLPVVILGTSFKPNTAIKTGSPAILLTGILDELGIEYETYDPVSDKTEFIFKKGLYFIGCAHSCIHTIIIPDGSIVIDPHRVYSGIIKNGKYIPIGIGS